MSFPIISLKNISLTFGGEPLFEDVNLDIRGEDKFCLVGKNGSGKSTLMKIIAGKIEPDNGEIAYAKGLKVRYLEQDNDISQYETVLDYVLTGLFSEQKDGSTHLGEIILDEIEVDPKTKPKGLSGGQIKKIAIAKTLVGNPDVLLLDEPTNHLDIDSIIWLENKLINFDKSLIVVSHDKRFLNNITNSTAWLDRGQIKQNNQGFSSFEKWSEKILQEEEFDKHNQNKLLKQEESWLNKGVTARRKRNQRRLKNLIELRKEISQRIDYNKNVNFSINKNTNSSKLVIEAKDISKSFGDNLIFSSFSTRIMKQDRVGIIGKNGIGKTTLLKVLKKELSPDSGTVRHGANLEIGYFDQKRQTLDPEKSIKETLCDKAEFVTVGDKTKHVIGYMKDFLFSPEQINTPVKALSGGEKNRLLLAKTLKGKANLLILDEPTNDLDLQTLEVLEEALSEYDGTIILISHDRDFLDKIVTSTVGFEKNGKLFEYAGGYSDYLRQKKQTQKDEEKKQKNKLKQKEKKQKPKTTNNKLSYKHQRALEILPSQIEEIDKKIKIVEGKLSDASFYEKDPKAFSDYSNLLEKYLKEKEGLEEQWLEIELIKEELGLE